LTVEHDAANVVIRVRDSGIGIAPEHLPRVFEMFAQIDTSLERSRDGLGLGLPLVKTLVQMHDGSVEARSDGLGRGSEFTVRLPLASARGEPQAAPTTDAPVRSPRRRILIVDDNHDGAESLAMMLELDGHQTHTAHDGLQALEAVERLRPDVVLLDIGLPKINGFEVCRRIRSEPWGKALTLVALTGWGQEEDRRRSKEAGFDEHLVKPVDVKSLVRVLASLPSASADEQRAKLGS
jgi:CheY-like chemotaxis protein